MENYVEHIIGQATGARYIIMCSGEQVGSVSERDYETVKLY